MNNEEKILEQIVNLNESFVNLNKNFVNFKEKTELRFSNLEEDVAFTKKIAIKLENQFTKMINLLTEHEDSNYSKINQHELRFIGLEHKVEKNTLDILNLKKTVSK